MSDAMEPPFVSPRDVDAPPKSPLWGGEHHCAASDDDTHAELWWVYGA